MSVIWTNKLVPSSGTYLCPMKGSMCRIRTLRGMSPPAKGLSRCKIYIKGYAWLGLRQARAIWLITLKRGADIKLNKASKTHEMQLQLDIKGSPCGRWPT